MGPYGFNRWCGATRPSLPMFESFASKPPGLTPSGRGILPSSRDGGDWGPMGLTADNLWNVSHEAQLNSTSIVEDIRSRSDYP